MAAEGITAQEAAAQLAIIVNSSALVLLERDEKSRELYYALLQQGLDREELALAVVQQAAATRDIIREVSGIAYDDGYFDGAVDAAARLSGQLHDIGVYLDVDADEDAGTVGVDISVTAEVAEQLGAVIGDAAKSNCCCR